MKLKQTTLRPPCIITARLMPGVRVGKAFISIEYAGVTRDGRTRYRYHIDAHYGAAHYEDLEFSSDDLKSGVGGGTLQEGLESLMAFLGAAAESYPDGESADLFPPKVVAWAYQHSDEISMIACELEETPNLIDEK